MIPRSTIAYMATMNHRNESPMKSIESRMLAPSNMSPICCVKNVPPVYSANRPFFPTSWPSCWNAEATCPDGPT